MADAVGPVLRLGMDRRGPIQLPEHHAGGPLQVEAAGRAQGLSLIHILDSQAVLAAIGGTGLIAGGAEAVVAGVLSAPILSALWKIRA